MRSLEFGATPTSVSARKSHCKHLHNPASHQLIQLRLMSGDSSNTEDEESIFNAIKGIIKSTSNNKALAMWSQIYYHDFKLKKKMGVEQAQQQSSRTTSVSSVTNNQATPSAQLLPGWPQIMKVVARIFGENKWLPLTRRGCLVEVSPRELTGGVFAWQGTIRHKEGRPSIASLPITSPKEEESYCTSPSAVSRTCLQDKIKVPPHFLRFPNDDGKVQECTTNYLE